MTGSFIGGNKTPSDLHAVGTQCHSRQHSTTSGDSTCSNQGHFKLLPNTRNQGNGSALITPVMPSSFKYCRHNRIHARFLCFPRKFYASYYMYHRYAMVLQVRSPGFWI